ncbi:MAG TPA: YCF48-related protein [Terriglobales bacterium]|nr:YCF48-related protein [Terriglobales bacterium]
MRLACIALLFAVTSSWWSVQTSGIDTNLRGVSVKGADGTRRHVIWASGSNGVILRSLDDGQRWKRLTIPSAGSLDFRDVEAFDADTAYVMSSGDGDQSRIYKTSDGGNSWKLQYSDKRPGFFLDSLACDSKVHCVALSDPVAGKFLVLATDDGEQWRELPRDKMPPALASEGAFAASGTAIAICDGTLFFGTGGPAGRVFQSADQGRSWTVTELPLASSNASSGIFSLACHGENVVAVGGDYKRPNDATRSAAYSHDFGRTWHLAETQPGGYRSAVAALSGTNFVAVGPDGTDLSRDGGIHWQHADSAAFNTIAVDEGEAWAAGPSGTIARFNSR